MSKNVLLVGRNPTVLANLTSALTDEGFAVKTTNRVEQADQEFDAAELHFERSGDQTERHQQNVLPSPH